MKKFIENCIIPKTNGDIYDLKIELDSIQGKVYSLIIKISEESAGLKKKSRKLEQEIERLRDMLKPFAHPDLCKFLPGNTHDDKSVVFQRDHAILRIGDFRQARNALKEGGK